MAFVKPTEANFPYLDPVLTGLLSCLVLKLTLDFFLFSRPRSLGLLCVDFATAHLPLHELAESTIRVGRQLLEGTFLGNLTISIDTNDAVRTLDGRQTVSNADGGVVLSQQLAKGLIDESL